MLGPRPRPPPGGALADPGHAQHLGPERLGGAYRRLLPRAGRLRLPVLTGLGLRGGAAVGPRAAVRRRLSAAAPGTVRTGVVVAFAIAFAGVLLQRLVQLVLVQARRVEGVAPAPVRQRQQRSLPYVLREHLGPPGPRRQRGGGPRHHDVGPHAVHLEGRAGRRDLPQRAVAEPHLRQQPPCRHDPLPYGGLLLGPPGRERGRVVVVRQPAAHHLDPLLGLPRGRDLHGQPEPVQQLRAQLALLGVHGAHEQEAGRMPHRDALALDVRGTHRRRVQQQVDQVVVEEVDLVDVQDPAVRVGQQARLERLHALGERPLDVERADQPVLGGADGQLDHPRGPLAAAAGLVRSVRAGRVGGGRVAREPAAWHHGHLGQQRRKGAHGRRLGGALLAPHQHTADRRRHGVQQQREPQVVLTDDGRKGERGGHWSPSKSPSSSR
ncbi:hypothetical protein GCM10017687_17700 [Streptomyces echinatus]